jgi:hypothetical protein
LRPLFDDLDDFGSRACAYGDRLGHVISG